MIIKQNKKTVAICALLSVVLLLSFVSFPVSASSTSFNLILTVGSKPQTAGISIYDSNENSTKYLVFSASATPVYVAFVNDIATKATTAGYFFFSQVEFTLYSGDSRYPNGGITTSQSQFDSDRNFYYVGPSGYTNTTPLDSVPVFNSRSDAFDAFESQIVNPPPSPTPIPSQPLTITIKPGYVLFADVGDFSENHIVVSTTSSIAITPSTQLSNNQLYGFSSSLPSGQFSMPLPGSMSFTWNPVTTNLYGKATNWIASRVFEPTEKYIFISNPLVSNYRLAGVNGNTEVVNDASVNNGNLQVTISFVNVSDVHLIPLNANYVYDPANGVEGVNQGGDGDNPIDVNVDPDGNVSYTDQNGDVVDPPSGGNTDISTPNMFQTITAWLENIAQQISGFFTGAVGAVSTLISAGTAFVQQLVGLYSWLPPAVLSVLSSALILVITIGVIKVFL